MTKGSAAVAGGSAKPPAGLSPGSRGLWKRLQREYQVVDSAGLAILEQALRSLDRAEEARALMAKAGSVVADRWGQLKPNPAAAIERDARAGFLSAIRQLKIEVPS